MVALNRGYALAKVSGKQHAIPVVEKLNLSANLFYHSLLGFLYSEIDLAKAIGHLETAILMANAKAEKLLISRRILLLKEGANSGL